LSSRYACGFFNFPQRTLSARWPGALRTPLLVAGAYQFMRQAFQKQQRAVTRKNTARSASILLSQRGPQLFAGFL